MLRPDAEFVVVSIVPDRYDPWMDAGGFEGPVLTEDEADEEYDEAVEDGREAVERTRAVGPAGAEGEVLVSEAGAGWGLVEAARNENVDLLVVGAEDKGWLARLVGGSVSDHLVHHAHCPVLVVRHDD